MTTVPLRRRHRRLGRGGRHPRPPARSDRQAHPPARARRPAPAGGGELGHQARSSSTTATSRRTRWRDGDGKAFQPQVHYFVGGATKLYGRRSTGSASGTSARWPTRRHLARLARRLRHLRAVLHPGGAAVLGARRARRGPHRAVDERAVPVPGRSRTSRGSSSSRTISPPPASIRSTRPAGSCSTRPTGRRASAFAARAATASRARCTPSPTPRSAPSQPALEHPNVTLLTGAPRNEARDGRGRHDRHGGAWSSVDGALEHVRRPTSSSSRAAPPTARSCCSCRRTMPTRTGSRTGPTRSAATTCSTRARPCSRCHASRTTRPTRRRSGSTTSTSRATTADFPLGNIQMVGKSQAEMFRGERPEATRLAPEWTLERMARHAIDFWLSTEDLPRPENRVTVDRDGTITLRYTPTNEEPKKRLYAKVKSILGRSRHESRSPHPPLRLHEERHPGRRRRPSGGNVPLRSRPGHVCPRRELQGPRARQPLRRRHELLPQHRCREPGPDRDGERAPRRRPPDREDGMSPTKPKPGAEQAARRDPRPARERPPPGGRLVPLGPVRQRAAVGHGARGLQRQRDRVGVPARTTTPARAPTAGARTASPGFCDVEQRLCLGLALWNGRDPILKERIFGLTGNQGNHGEDAKEYWWYLDATPSHSWNRWRYHYPQGEYPVRGARRGERGARQARSRSTSCSTRASSTTTATGSSRRTTPRPTPSTSF